MIPTSMKNSILNNVKGNNCYSGSVECFDNHIELVEELYAWFRREGFKIYYVEPLKDFNCIEFKIKRG